MSIDDLTRNLFRMPPDTGPADNCPGCMTRTSPSDTTPAPGGIQCAYTCVACSWTWECAWWEGER